MNTGITPPHRTYCDECRDSSRYVISINPKKEHSGISLCDQCARELMRHLSFQLSNLPQT